MKWMTILLLVWFLQGCTTLEGKSVALNQALVIPAQWQAQGRASVSMEDYNQTTGFEIDFKNQHYVLILSAPLGLGQIVVKSNTQGLRVNDKQINLSLKQWMIGEFGWHFPIQKLALILFKQQKNIDHEWRINIISYQQIDEIGYPKIVRLNHLTKAIKIKLLISKVNELK